MHVCSWAARYIVMDSAELFFGASLCWSRSVYSGSNHFYRHCGLGAFLPLLVGGLALLFESSADGDLSARNIFLVCVCGTPVVSSVGVA